MTSQDELSAAQDAIEQDAVEQDAADTVPAEGTEEVDIDEGLPEEPDKTTPEGHRERSELGRKVKAIEDNFNLMSEEMRTFMEEMRAARQGDDYSDDSKSVTEIVNQTIEARETAKQKKQQEYNVKAYRALDLQGTDLSTQAYDVIRADAEKNWIHHTGNAEVDAKINFLDARARVREQQLKTRTNPLSKNTQDVDGLGGESGSVTDQRFAAPPKLSKAAQEFLDGHIKSTDSKIPEKLGI